MADTITIPLKLTEDQYAALLLLTDTANVGMTRASTKPSEYVAELVEVALIDRFRDVYGMSVREFRRKRFTGPIFCRKRKGVYRRRA